MRRILLTFLMILAVALTGCAPSARTESATGTAAAPAPGGTGATTVPAGGAGTTVPVTGNEAKVTISGFAFDPNSITIKVGESVTWTNQDSAGHTVTADDNSWTSPTFKKGETFTQKFTTAGTFTYHCSIHPTMKGTVIVQP
jgi:plastocyanin